MSKTQQLVSVIVPTYNRAHFVGQAITSVLNQTYENIELLVIDDGSTDHTAEVVGSFDDPRLNYIRLDRNVGRSAARNKGLESARGYYVTFLDSDDYYLPAKIEIQVQFLNENPQYGMVYTASGCFTDEDSPINYLYRAPVSGDIYPEIAFFKPLTITLPTVMLRKEVVGKVGGFDECMSRFEDTDYWRRISRHFRIGAIDEVTVHVRTHDGNLITAFHPSSFEQAIEYYVGKVRSEDADVDPLILGAGARRLHELYAKALPPTSEGQELAARLMAKGQEQFQPFVSIIMPVYNGANYLRQAIDSALAQTYANVEIVIVNDGSTDAGATERIIESYGDRVRGFSQPNGGCAAALNRAIKEARGDYVSWLSHDDLMAPTKLERQVAMLCQQADPTSSIVYGDYSVFYGDEPVFSDRPAITFPKVRPEDFRYFLTTQNILHGCTLLMPRRAIVEHGMFDESLRTVLDFDLWFRLAETNRFVFCPDVGIHSRAHPDQDSNRKRDLFMTEANDMLARFARELSPDEITSASNTSLILGYYLIAESFHQRNFDGAAERTVLLVESRVRDLLAADDADARKALESLFALSRHSIEKAIFSQLVGPPAYAPVRYECSPNGPAVKAMDEAPPGEARTPLGETQAPIATSGELVTSPRTYKRRFAVFLVGNVRRVPLANQLGLKVFCRLPRGFQDRLVNAWRSR
ncbi:glycosyltransferase family 2 protein [Bosea sp. 2YAB26]|uniref:glycosyltransferase family 2 protein n=1 Tax=Bosea sp. 2YAB26 TaxID=3237478 RepID=UPI003F8D93CD